MPKLVLDIETIGVCFDSLDKITQESLTRWIKKESFDEDEYRVALRDLKEGLGFSPLTGEIVAIGVLDVEKNKGAVYVQSPGKAVEPWSNDIFSFQPMTEEEMIKKFWEGAKQYSEFITFNGRAFDVPFILARGAKYGIRSTKDLMSNRYTNSQKFEAKHIDLLDQLNFYGVTRKKGNLHLWCKLFGIKSPKTEEITGEDVAPLFAAKEYKKIAEYNSLDLTATRELYLKWEKYLKF
jgi:DNA polymerase elongation subunit (family B)